MDRTFEEAITDLVKNADTGHLDKFMDVSTELFVEDGEGFFELIELLLEKYVPHRKKNEDEYFCCCAVFSAGLQLLHEFIEDGEDWAVELSEDIQATLAEDVFNSKQDEEFQSDILQMLEGSHLSITDELKEANFSLFDDIAEELSPEELEFDAMFDDLIKVGVDCPFDVAETLQTQFKMLPTEAQVMLVREMLASDISTIKEAATLMLLHPDEEVRCEIPILLHAALNEEKFSPISLRRMIGLRNWLPEDERPALDDVIRATREAGVDCAPWPSAERVDVYAEEFEDDESEGITIVTKSGGAINFATILADKFEGFSLCTTEEDLVQEEVDGLLKELLDNPEECESDIDYLNETIPFYLGVSHEEDSVPPLALLRIAELVGVSDWYPEPVEVE